MKIKLSYTCSCGFIGFIELEEASVILNALYAGNCGGCPNTIAIEIKKIDKEKKIVSYHVQIKKPEPETKNI